MHEELAETTESSSHQKAAVEALESLLEDFSWKSRRSDGSLVDLASRCCDGKVRASQVPAFLSAWEVSRLEESRRALDAMREGLTSVLPASFLPVFTWEELELMICGSDDVDIDLLEQNTEYDDDLSADDVHVRMFW